MDKTNLQENYDRRLIELNRVHQNNKSDCNHINIFKSEEGLKIYNTVHSHFIACTTPLYRKRKIVNTRCHQCLSRRRLHSCLHCVFFGCYDGHVQAHYALEKHYLYVDLIYGNILCMKCGDYEYDDDLADIASRNIIDASRSLGHPIPSWVPIWLTKNEISEIQKHAKRLRVNIPSPIGLRPLENLGNTCYMNCVIQILMHTPLLRNYLMSGRHKCSNDLCILCEVSQLFQKFYCGARSSLAPDRFLYLLWKHVPIFAGEKQQDAQECFLAILDILHENCVHTQEPPSEDLQTPPTVDTDELHLKRDQTIIEQIFRGKYQSDIMCQACTNRKPTKMEAFWDIQLDVQSDCSTLLDCLKRFTNPEVLGLEHKLVCTNCTTIQDHEKQLTVKKIPIVASFQLKRFSKGQKKISTNMPFPELLDMTPFMTNRRNGAVAENVFTPYDNQYVLFGVIVHDGTYSDAGHYTAFVRVQPNYWYKCDDAKEIVRVSLKEVLNSQG